MQNKGSGRTGRKLKRSVKKTLGAIFLISALVVAAIPTNNFTMEASQTIATSDDWGTLVKNLGDTASKIPVISSSEQIYTTGDGRFRFAYVYPKGASTGDKYAVILGFPKDGNLENYTLTIPDTVDAYAKLTDTLGSDRGRTAVGKQGNFLYYKVVTKTYEYVDRIDNETGLPARDDDGNVIQDKIEHVATDYYPCYYEDRVNWEENDITDFYYYPGNDTSKDIKQTLTNDVQRIQAATVMYIGNQYLVAGDIEGSWKVGGTIDYSTREQGIFAGVGNLRYLAFGSHMSGIGDYAFYGCGNLQSITLNDGLNTIGVGAFAECSNMKTANIDLYSNITVIGDYAFYGCRSLTSFSVPTQVTTLGNSVFENCRAMATIELTGNGEEVQLQKMGSNVFRGCEALESLTYPRDYIETVEISGFIGCVSLKYIATPKNSLINFSGSQQDFITFKNTVGTAFYFQGVKDSPVHKTATANEIAFSFVDDVLKADVYEITKTEQGYQAVWRVDDNNNLVYCKMDDGMSLVTIPEVIGPRSISTIDSDTFQDNHYIEKLYIPATIQNINTNAFRACHNLKYVFFADGANPNIASGAFRTQDGVELDDTDKTKCTKTKCSNHTLNNPPALYFIGEVSYSSTAFEYAMNPNEYINNGKQTRTYITYLSGWPTHLEIRYNPDTDKNELIDYPTFSAVSGSKYTMSAYPYMTSDYVSSMKSAVEKYNKNEALDDYEREIINAALNLNLPEGIESIAEDLFIKNEASESQKKTISAASLKSVDEGAFKGCTNLVGVTLSDATESIGKYAFEGCKNLTTVNLPATVSSIGLRPFKDCTSLSNVNFNGGPYFTCENSIIYSLDGNGDKDTIIECLEGRSNAYVTAEETAGVKAIYEEAFMNQDLVNIDLTDTEITSIPEYCFAYTPSLTQVSLPKTIRNVKDNAFKNSNIRILTIPGQYQNITTLAFGDGIYRGDDDDHTALPATNATNLSKLLFICEEGSMAEDYAKTNGISYSYQASDNEYTVSFYDKDGVLIESQKVKEGGSAIPPTAPSVDGYTFTQWLPATYQYVTADIPFVQAQYEKNDVVINKYKVTFVDDDEAGTVLYTQTVEEGNDVIIPQNPTKDGYTFKGWKGNLTNIVRDETVYAYYEKNTDSSSNNSGNNSSGNNSSGNNNSGSSNNNGSSSTATLYVLTVQNGSGSGNYAEGSQPIVIANDPASGQEFSHWTIDPATTKIASTVLTATVITMPAGNVTVTAHYKAKTSTSTGTGNTTTVNKPSSSNVSSSGTSVVIDKNGLSNTGVVSATVNGSSDNFTIKITESTAATEAALRALMTDYGNDLSNIKYFPMDISLYDASGTKKITDTTGLAIKITIPLPDSLIPYAGNNKVASVVNDRLETLGTKFTTINGVACVTFTAEHFSPYVIYVNTSNITTAGTAANDSTPKTGDGIHPKWFLSVGLACLSMVMFFQKDNRKKRKVKA